MATRRTKKKISLANNVDQFVASPSHSGALIINAVPYTTASSIYDDNPANSAQQHLRLNFMVTVSIPPHLRAFRYPNLSGKKNNKGTTVFSSPILSDDDRLNVASRNQWYNAAKNTNGPDIKRLAAQKKQRARDEARLELAKKALAKHPHDAKLQAAVDKYTKRVAYRSRIIKELKRRINRLQTYSTTYDITQFVTSLSWSTSTKNSKINLPIGLDNSQGLFDYIPLGAKITVWRRKAINDFNTGKSTYGKKWNPYFVTYIVEKDKEATGRAHTMTITCEDRMSRMERMVPKKLVYSKKDKNHPKGWTPREITIDVCQTNGIPYNASAIPHKAISNSHTLDFDETKATPGSGQSGLAANQVNATTKLTSSQYVKLPRLESYDPGDDDKNAAGIISGCWHKSVDLLKKAHGISYPIIHMRSGLLEVHFLSPPGRDVLSQTQVVGFGENNIETIHYNEQLSSDIVGTDRMIGGEKKEQKTYTQLLASGTYNTKKKNENGKWVKKPVKIKARVFNPENAALVWEAYGKIQSSHTFKQVFRNKRAFEVAAQKMVDNAIEPHRTLTITAKAPVGLWEFDYIYINSRLFTVRGLFPIESITYNIESGHINATIEVRIIQAMVDQGYSYYEGSKSKYDALPGSGNKHPDKSEKWY